MAGRSAPEWVTIKARIPRGFEDYWKLILAFDSADGCFTTGAISAETNVQRQSVEHYVARLVAGGVAEIVRVERDERRRRRNVYRLLKRPSSAPRLREDGSAVGTNAQMHLWRAMRTLKTFTTRELAYAAATSRLVALKTAQRYVNELARAGYLISQGPNNQPKQYRLKPGMNTGPLPPSILVGEIVWDRNRREIVGDTVLREVA